MKRNSKVASHSGDGRQERKIDQTALRKLAEEFAWHGAVNGVNTIPNGAMQYISESQHSSVFFLLTNPSHKIL